MHVTLDSVVRADPNYTLLLRVLDKVEHKIPFLVQYLNHAGRHYPKHYLMATELLLPHALRMRHGYCKDDDIRNPIREVDDTGLVATLSRILLASQI